MEKLIMLTGFFILSITIFSCSDLDNNSQKKINLHTDISPQTEEVKKLIPNNQNTKNIVLTDSVIELYSGFWLNDSFLKQIKKNKSIYNSKKIESELFGFTIDKEDLNNGTLIINGFTVHEGGYGVSIKWLSDSGHFTSKGQIDNSSSYKTPMNLIINEKNLIEFQFQNSNSEYYRKVTDSHSELRRILFEGKFIDSLKNNYYFSSNGKLSGFENKQYYRLLYDFIEGLYFDVVFISDNEESENELLYHYKFLNDTLRLFEIRGEFPEYKIGGLRYELYKK